MPKRSDRGATGWHEETTLHAWDGQQGGGFGCDPATDGTRIIINAGCDDYAGKPIDRQKLVETIEAHLRSASVSA